jgi:hypothetical protein
MASNRLTTSLATSLTAWLTVLESVLAGGAGGALVAWLSSVVNAVCAAEISSFESAVLTLEINCPIGLFESALEGVSCSTCVRYFCADVVSPDWMADMRLENASAKAFLLVELVEETDEALISESRELLWIPKIDMMVFLSRKFLQDILAPAHKFLKSFTLTSH